ncbi:hypothetical protein [Dysgonomonas capnocytophagoides]|uniref:hypothetical protein n=1 Tax=Dysgonomonas capnocytophagoides TaxID=45254 RepID=UPI0033425CCF
MEQMQNLGIVEDTAEYTIYQASFKGTIQLFRKNKQSGLIEIKFSNEFAKAQGYQSIGDMLRHEPELRFRLNVHCGGIPEYIQIVNGEFCVKTTMTAN